MTPSPFTLATCQSLITPDARVNGAHLRDLMRRAHAAGARLAHFPEGALTGYAKHQIQDWSAVDWDAVREEFEAVAALAGALGLWTVVGGAHPLTPPHWPHNSLYVISDAGQLVGRYDKRRLSQTEVSRFYTPGFEPLVFEVDGWHFGCAICVEVVFPDVFAEYERLGVDALLLSMYVDLPDRRLLSRAHAATNGYWLSLANAADCAHALPTEVFGPDGEPLKTAPREEVPAVLVTTLDPQTPDFHVPINLARPWRRKALAGDLYTERRVDDERSRDRLTF